MRCLCAVSYDRWWSDGLFTFDVELGASTIEELATQSRDGRDRIGAGYEAQEQSNACQYVGNHLADCLEDGKVGWEKRSLVFLLQRREGLA